ncbi:hypothetical protein [Halalkalibacter sp. APA_J-10(15)]|uniref:hypothetical protein n=1 Tax=Halalkalibacter sp. APA_J-10(15) TaxID=2933805 RepID=UPI001FF3649B|nr:hypothetical protein [Halalkalibacter sp. APA_J-10(15)]MCK0470872.1 hypothetical protein [Halalkalibacter sp. APA_J-10(15)]
MLFAFQILLFVLIVLFAMGAIGEEAKEDRGNSVAIVVASILALGFSFWVE